MGSFQPFQITRGYPEAGKSWEDLQVGLYIHHIWENVVQGPTFHQLQGSIQPVMAQRPTPLSCFGSATHTLQGRFCEVPDYLALPLQSSATNIPDYRLQWLWLVTFKCRGFVFEPFLGHSPDPCRALHITGSKIVGTCWHPNYPIIRIIP